MCARPAKRVLLVGWDAADLKLAMPLLESGRMPTLARLIGRGAHGLLRSSEPYQAGPTWTTLATGVRPHDHEILTDLEPDGLGDVRPVSSTSRRTRAIWNYLSQHGLVSHVVGFPASYPAEAIRGCVVTDRFSQTAGLVSRLWPSDEQSVHPPEIRDELMALRATPSDLREEEVREFVPGIRSLVEKDKPRLAYLVGSLARCVSIHNAATHLAARDDWSLLAVRYELIAAMSREFCEDAAAASKPGDTAASRPFAGVIPAAYRFCDLMLERLLELAGEGTTVLVVSNHGFCLEPAVIQFDIRNERFAGPMKKRPINPLRYHRSMGMFVAAGPAIAHGRVRAQLLDICPTVLALFGLPIPEQITGRPLQEAFALDEPVRSGECDIAPVENDGVWPAELFPDVWTAQLLLSQLAGFGCLKFDPTDAAAIEHAIRMRLQHLAQSLMEAGRFESALAVWRELERREQASYPKIHLAECLMHLGRLDESDEVISALERVSPGAVVVAVLRARWLSEKGNHQEAYDLAMGALRERSDLPEVAFQCGVFAMRMESWQVARGHFEYALRLDVDHLGAREALRFLSQMVSTT